MFCLRQFAAAYFARRYFPAGLGSGVIIRSVDASLLHRTVTAGFARRVASVLFQFGGS